MALVLVAGPYLVWAIIVAPYGIGTGILGIVVLAILFLSYSALGLGFSALTARPAGSAVLTQAMVFFLILGLPAVFGLLYGTTGVEHTVVRDQYIYASNNDDFDPVCKDRKTNETFHHTERIWWLLAPNPFLIAADTVAAQDNPEPIWDSINGVEQPSPSVARDAGCSLSSLRSGPFIADQHCGEPDFAMRFDEQQGAQHQRPYYERRKEHDDAHIGQSWYIGLLVNIAIGALGFIIAARRLRVPADRLPRGVRIA